MIFYDIIEFFFFFAHFLEETPEEWIQKWKNECHNVRDAEDLVYGLSNQIINSQKILLDRKRIRNSYH